MNTVQCPRKIIYGMVFVKPGFQAIPPSGFGHLQYAKLWDQTLAVGMVWDEANLYTQRTH